MEKQRLQEEAQRIQQEAQRLQEEAQRIQQETQRLQEEERQRQEAQRIQQETQRLQEEERQRQQNRIRYNELSEHYQYHDKQFSYYSKRYKECEVQWSGWNSRNFPSFYNIYHDKIRGFKIHERCNYLYEEAKMHFENQGAVADELRSLEDKI